MSPKKDEYMRGYRNGFKEAAALFRVLAGYDAHAKGEPCPSDKDAAQGWMDREQEMRKKLDGTPFMDREWLKSKILGDGEEGEIGVGFELFQQVEGQRK